ncbi:hypothetical protein J1N35_022110 [Gossypium stocksii]|uniref:Uncharacterized protein n=1 Tax=Gossypium stocksii TaxID=47602 RepID=A0A9D3VH36_9ROSI|nr:hypothetical protein J1N35_022110 [Gossypium stocksii]
MCLIEAQLFEQQHFVEIIGSLTLVGLENYPKCVIDQRGQVSESFYKVLRELEDHLTYYNNHMNILDAFDKIKYRAFSMTLAHITQAWYLSLPRCSIHNFDHLANLVTRPYYPSMVLVTAKMLYP